MHRTRGILLVSLAAVTLVASLACGAEWEKATQDAIADQASEMRGKLLNASESPERDEVDQILKDLQAHPEGVGFVELGMFAAEVEMAIDDGTITADEVDTIRAKHAEITAPE